MSFHITDDVKAAEKNETVVVDEAKKPADTTKRDDRRKHQHTSPLSSNMMDVLAGAMKQGLPFNVMNMRI